MSMVLIYGKTKDLHTRYERTLQESEVAMEKSKAKFDMTAEELERLLVQKEGESMKKGTRFRCARLLTKT